MTDSASSMRDKPWIFRTYAGHSTAAASNKLYRTNLARGQTGLSIAFDLPTQTGYDSDHLLAKGEVGKVGVPVSHLGDMRTLFDGLPLEEMNTSMTINAPAAWLLALYVALADERGDDRKKLRGTTQNDIVKEYLSRGTYVFPPEPSLRLISDMVSWCYTEVPKWNPMNVCSYHLQEAGATPEQELAYALATAIAVLDRVKAGGQVPESDFETVFGRISFFVNAGVRFVTELCKMRSFVELWEEIGRERYGVSDPKALLRPVCRYSRQTGCWLTTTRTTTRTRTRTRTGSRWNPGFRRCPSRFALRSRMDGRSEAAWSTRDPTRPPRRRRSSGTGASRSPRSRGSRRCPCWRSRVRTGACGRGRRRAVAASPSSDTADSRRTR